MRFRELFEKRRNPEVNKTPSYLEVISHYANLPNSDEYYVSFTDVPKIGIKPIPQWKDTPIGVYAYPIKYVFDNNGQVRFSNRKYANIIKETTPPFNKSTPSEDILTKARATYKAYLLDKLKDHPDIDYIKDDIEYYVTTPIRATIAKEVYQLASLLASLARKEGIATPHYVLHNKLLRMVGIHSVLDNGEGFIYDEEPIQAVFLDNTSYKLVERVETKRNKDANS